MTMRDAVCFSSVLPHPTHPSFASLLPIQLDVFEVCNRCLQKEVVYNHIKQLYLCYTILGMGWWYQIAFPRLPSGKIDYAISIPTGEIPGDGNAPSSLTDLCDISKYVATIITDDRTRNKMVLAYNETWSLNQVFDLLEQLSGEKLERKYVCLDSPFPDELGCLTVHLDI